MFYEIEVPGKQPGSKNWVAALVVLNPSESRRLLAKATVALPEVQHALKHGTIIIGRGITNAYVTEEILGIRIEPKAGLTFGMVCAGITTGNSGPPACSHHVIREGKVVEGADSKVEILSFGPDDVFIKGANAIDPEGNAGILTSSLIGGTIGMAWPVADAPGLPPDSACRTGKADPIRHGSRQTLGCVLLQIQHGHAGASHARGARPGPH